ncbi:MAG: hypothetical protein OEQ28_05360, partial [Acidobacteriota bacterium]|nr:hypothetical protein [Acidobacteriota bacterium]
MKTSEIAQKLGGELHGDPDLEIKGLSDIKTVADHQLAFLASESDVKELSRAPRSACILVGFPPSSDLRCTAIRVAEPKVAFARIAAQILRPVQAAGWHESAVIAEDATVEAAYIGANVSIGKGARVGVGAVLHDGVRVGAHTKIGERTTIYPNAV